MTENNTFPRLMDAGDSLSDLLKMSRGEVEAIATQKGIAFTPRMSKKKIAEAIDRQAFNDKRRAAYLPHTKDIL
jgi:hypothetical protein